MTIVVLHQTRLLWPYKIALRASRSIYVVSSDKKKTYTAKKTEYAEKFIENEYIRKKTAISQFEKQGIQEMKSLAKQASDFYQNKTLAKDDAIPINDEKTNQLYNAVTNKPKKNNVRIPKNAFIFPAIDIPPAISDKLGLSLKYLVSKDKQDWNMVLQQLNMSDGFANISSHDVTKFIRNIPPQHLAPIIPQIEAMLLNANLKISNKVITVFIDALSHSPSVSDETIDRIESYIPILHKNNKSNQLSKDSYISLIRAYGKNNNMIKINQLLTEMKSFGIQSSSAIFSNILTTSVYKAKDHKQAVEIFDTMKFISQETKPNTQNYQDIIVSYINNRDIEKALDLYQEMIINKVNLNQSILVALARGCATRKELKYKAWDFMFEIHENGWTPTMETYEYMLYLAAKDGDLTLARALYAKLLSTNSTSPRSFGFILLAYAKAKNDQDRVSFLPPALMSHTEGRKFRSNILADSIITKEGCLPFLPIATLTSKEILAESSAFWAYSSSSPHLITTQNACTFINIVVEHGTISDFIDRYNSATHLDTTGAETTRKVIIEDDHVDNEVEDSDNDLNSETQARSKALETYNENSIVKSPLLNNISFESKSPTAPRLSLTYIVALKAAGKFNNYKFAKKVWSERGQYRKCESFKSLSKTEREELDFLFANEMIQCLTKMNYLEDALAILISTEYQFKWTWRQLSSLNEAAVEIGATRITSTLRGIASRAQLNFAGKIRRKDYKLYVAKRGY